MSARDLVIRRAASMLLVVGIMMLAYTGLVLADAWRFKTAYYAQETPTATNVAPASTSLPLGRPPVDGQAIGEIRIDRIGLREVIGQGDSAKMLRRAVGHLADSAWIGEPGNIVLAGHRDTTFRALQGVHVGDRIEVSTPTRRARYEVEFALIVPPTDTGTLASSDRNTLTLVTCYPFTYVGPAPERFVVRAIEIR